MVQFSYKLGAHGTYFYIHDNIMFYTFSTSEYCRIYHELK